MLMEGYYGKERHETFTPDGWFRSGDVFVRDEDGFYFFKGRRGDMIKTGGANVSPREVEAAISEVTGGVSSVVFGLPDDDRGQVVVGVLLTDDPTVDTGGVIGRLRGRLSSYKLPRRLLVIAPRDMPLLSSGKPDLNRLAEAVRGGAERP
jgi:acyl-CoA synthetase (AMP-forming)/AMP-acid ligase II